jgi:cytochrome c2
LKQHTLRLLLLLFLLAGGAALTACAEAEANTAVAERLGIPEGDAARGRQAIEEYGCGSCHTIPGVPGANAWVGPPLNNWAQRQYIAGNVPNSPDNLIRWIRDPQAIEPGTLMPDTGVTFEAARDIAVYLYTLEDD